MAKNIYLVGFMGAGKTRVGQCLSELLNCRFIDLDVEIELRASTRIREIFELCGEAAFRQLESRELLRVSAESGAVIAVGGGAFCSAENRNLIRSTGSSVWLDAPIEVLCERCEGDDSRPLFRSRPEMQALLEARLPSYAEADVRVPVAGFSPEEIARQIAALLWKT